MFICIQRLEFYKIKQIIQAEIKQTILKTTSDFVILLNLHFGILFVCRHYRSSNKFSMLVFPTFLSVTMERANNQAVSSGITRPLHAPASNKF